MAKAYAALSAHAPSKWNDIKRYRLARRPVNWAHTMGGKIVITFGKGSTAEKPTRR